MHSLSKNIQKIIVEFAKLNTLIKAVIKLGFIIFTIIFAVGTALYIINYELHGHDPYRHYVATLVIKNSFIILAEVVIGCLLIDFVFKKQQ